MKYPFTPGSDIRSEKVRIRQLTARGIEAEARVLLEECLDTGSEIHTGTAKSPNRPKYLCKLPYLS